MRKRTLVSLLFYFFISTNARKVREMSNANNFTRSVGDVIADMVRTFALSGENGQLAFNKSDKSGKLGRGPYGNAFSSIFLKMFLDDEEVKANLVGMEVNGPLTQVCEDMLEGKLQEWLNISQPCRAGFKQIVCEPLGDAGTIPDAIKKLLLHSPILKMLDAWQKIPERILLGNFQWIGSYDECTSIPEAKYCSSDLGIPSVKSLKNQTIAYGSCFPRKCSTEDVSKMMDRLLKLIKEELDPFLVKVHTSVPAIINTRTLCDNDVDYYTFGWKITMAIVAILALLSVLGTLCDAVQQCLTGDPGETDSGIQEFKLECGINNTSFTTTQYPTSDLVKSQSQSNLQTMNNIVCDDADASFRSPSTCNNGERTSCNDLLNFFLCFSLLRNSKTIFSTRVPEGTIRCINGIRVISFTWIILGNYHIYGILRLKTDNFLKIVDGAAHSFTFLAVSNAWVSVDSFFVLGGFLVSYLTLKKFGKTGLKWSNILKSYFHRFIRLTPSLGLVMVMYNFLPQILRGPQALTITQTDEMQGGCHNYWWSVIFYFNNFYPSYEAGCLSWTYYLANDMQFFIISPFVLLLMLKVDRWFVSNRTLAVCYNFMLLMSICIASFLITGIITYIYNLPAIPISGLLSGSPYSQQDMDNVVNMIYTKPYCRITPYIVGLFLGYLVSKDIKPKVRGIGKFITATGWMSAIAGALTVVYGPWREFQKNGTFFSPTEVGLYSACHRFVWGCAVAWVIYACHNRRGGIVNTILSWKIWMPLSRLTYSAFLMHLEIIYIHTLLKETPVHYQINETVFSFISITVLTYAGAFVLAVCVEYPIVNLEKFVRRVFFK